ncbi:MAG TPA: cytochrome c biogenesis protein CcdA, partial [Chthonomonadales bacterium]|nr:cytochrome c biogenesis protein CcdA [Chthonomonadales bacterium]
VKYPKPSQAATAGEVLPVFEGSVKIIATEVALRGAKPARATLPISVHYQGCNATSCYPPTSITTSVSVVVARSGAGVAPARHKKRADAGGILVQAQYRPAAPESQDAVSVPGFQASEITQFEGPKDFLTWLRSGGSQAGKADLVTRLLKSGGALNFAGALGLIYLLGLALNLTPCVYPLIPITIGYFGKQAASGARTGGLSVCYALGMALMYSALGVLAAIFGKLFGSQLSNPYVLVGFAALMLALGLSMFDRKDGRPIWELQLPGVLTSKAKSRAGYAGALLMGLMVGIVAAPCIGPIVVALIKVIGDTQNVALGLVTFFVLGVGLATPFLLLGLGLIKALPRAGDWMVGVKHLFGLLLFGMAIYYLRGVLPAAIYRLLFTGYAVCAGLYLIAWDRTARKSAGFQWFRRAAGAAAIAVGVWALIPAATSRSAGQAIQFQTPKDYAALQSLLSEARSQNRPVLIDFSASWCAACHELEEKTFHDPNVAQEASSMLALRFQLEDFSSSYVKPFRDTFKIKGLPTVVRLVPDSAAGSSI